MVGTFSLRSLRYRNFMMYLDKTLPEFFSIDSLKNKLAYIAFVSILLYASFPSFLASFISFTLGICILTLDIVQNIIIVLLFHNISIDLIGKAYRIGLLFLKKSNIVFYSLQSFGRFTSCIIYIVVTMLQRRLPLFKFIYILFFKDVGQRDSFIF